MGIQSHQSFYHSHLTVFILVAVNILVKFDPFGKSVHERCTSALRRLIFVTNAATERVEKYAFNRVCIETKEKAKLDVENYSGHDTTY